MSQFGFDEELHVSVLAQTVATYPKAKRKDLMRKVLARAAIIDQQRQAAGTKKDSKDSKANEDNKLQSESSSQTEQKPLSKKRKKLELVISSSSEEATEDREDAKESPAKRPRVEIKKPAVVATLPKGFFGSPEPSPKASPASRSTTPVPVRTQSIPDQIIPSQELHRGRSLSEDNTAPSTTSAYRQKI